MHKVTWTWLSLPCFPGLLIRYKGKIHSGENFCQSQSLWVLEQPSQESGISYLQQLLKGCSKIMPLIVPWGSVLGRWIITTAKWLYLERCKNPIFSDFLMWRETCKGNCEKKPKKQWLSIIKELASAIQDTFILLTLQTEKEMLQLCIFLMCRSRNNCTPSSATDFEKNHVSFNSL